MGGLTSLANALSPVLGIAQLSMEMANAADDRREAGRLAALQREQTQEEAKSSVADLRRQRAEEQRVSQSALRRAMAERRAQLASSGVETGSGSGEALLLGLVDEARLRGDALDAETESQIDSIRRQASYGVQTNLLNLQSRLRRSRADQLREALPQVGSILSDFGGLG